MQGRPRSASLSPTLRHSNRPIEGIAEPSHMTRSALRSVTARLQALLPPLTAGRSSARADRGQRGLCRGRYYAMTMWLWKLRSRGRTPPTELKYFVGASAGRGDERLAESASTTSLGGSTRCTKST